MAINSNGRGSGQGRGERARRTGSRGRHGPLNRERVLAAALELIDREGLSALSMRRVGAELGVEAMALYRYAPSRDALLEGLVEALYIEFHAYLAAEPDGSVADGPGASGAKPVWRAELHRIAQATYRVALTHPHVVPLLATRMLTVPLARRPLAVLEEHERVLALFEAAGLDEKCASAAFRTFTSWVLGYVFAELRAVVDNPEESDPSLRFGLYRMSVHELPRLRKVAPALAEHGGPAGLDVGLDALLDLIMRP